jgi:predicted  nucleic acid-binding Zn-ribbon protein
MSSKKGKQGTAAAAGFSDLQQWLNERLSAVGREVAGVAEQMRRVERKVDRVEEQIQRVEGQLDMKCSIKTKHSQFEQGSS